MTADKSQQALFCERETIPPTFGSYTRQDITWKVRADGEGGHRVDGQQSDHLIALGKKHQAPWAWYRNKHLDVLHHLSHRPELQTSACNPPWLPLHESSICKMYLRRLASPENLPPVLVCMFPTDVLLTATMDAPEEMLKHLHHSF